MKNLTSFGIGGTIGLFVGIGFAEWVDVSTMPAYVLLVALSVIVFSAVARLFG